MFRKLAKALNHLDLRTFSMELLIVIVGVFLALQVNNWNEQRKALIEAEGYRARLASDFELIGANLQRLENVFNSRIEAADQLRGILDSPLSDESLLRGNELLGVLLYGGSPVTRSATFVEMLEGSKLELLNDGTLIEALIICDASIQAEQTNTRVRAENVRVFLTPVIRLALDTEHLPIADAFEIALADKVNLKRALVLSGLADAAGLGDTRNLRECSTSIVDKLYEASSAAD